MTTPEEHELNCAAYRRLTDEIDRTYPVGRFVALAGGRIVADSEHILELHARLQAAGYHTSDVLVVQAGVPRLESSLILFQRTVS
jgi:hypothetical protein